MYKRGSRYENDAGTSGSSIFHRAVSLPCMHPLKLLQINLSSVRHSVRLWIKLKSVIRLSSTTSTSWEISHVNALHAQFHFNRNK